MSKSQYKSRSRYHRHLLNLERLEDRTVPATHVWQGPVSGGLWSNAANWTNGVPTANEAGGTIVQFDGGITSTMNIVGLEVDEIVFTAGGNTILGTTTLTIDGSGAVDNVLNTGDNLLDFSMPISVITQALKVVSTSGNLSFSGDIAGSVGVTVQPANVGTVTLAGTNAFTGQTNVQGGTLRVLNSNGFGAASSGTVVAAGSTLALASINSSEPITINGGKVTTTGAITPTLNGNITLGSGTSAFDIPSNANLTLNGVISGAGNLRKAGAGTLTIGGSSSNTFTGGSFINDGQVDLAKTGGANAFAGVIGLQIGDGAGVAGSAFLQQTTSNNFPNTYPVAVAPDGLYFAIAGVTETIGSLVVIGGGNVSWVSGLTVATDLILNGSLGDDTLIVATTSPFSGSFGPTNGSGSVGVVTVLGDVIYDALAGTDLLIAGGVTFNIGATTGSLAGTNIIFDPADVESYAGATGSETFNVTPSATHKINIDGQGGNNTLVIDLTGTTTPFHIPTGPNSGHTTYGNRQDVDYVNIQNFSGINGTFATNPGPSNLSLFIGANFDENENAGIIGSFTNPDGEAHTVTIDFGDGSAPVVLNLLAGENGFQANHVYLDDDPSGTVADSKTVTVTVSDGISSVTATRSTLIHNVAPSNVTVSATPTTAGSASTITVNFTDPGTLDPHLIDIDFGDGSPVQSFGVAPGQSIFNKTHVYANVGTFTITATVHDDDLGTAPPAQTTVDVGNPDTTPPTIFSTAISKIQFNKSDAGNATLVVTVNYDEAMDTSINPTLTFSPGVAPSFTLTSSQWTNSTRHVFTYSFADANVEIITFGTVAGAKDVAGNQMAPHGLSVGISIDTVLPLVASVDDGDADNVVIVNTPLIYTITFSESISGGLSANDLDNAGTASISIGTITNVGAGVFTVVVTPTSAGTLRLRIPSGATVTDLIGNPLATPVSDDDTLTVILAVPVVTPAGNQSGSEGASKLFNLGSFADQNNSGNYTVTVNWGDGTPNTLFNQAGVGAITAQNHTYAQDGNFPVTITVSDADGLSTPVGFQANIGNVLPVAVDAPDQNGVATIAKAFALGSFTDPGADAPWHITVNWGDGSPNGSFTVNTPGELPALTHAFANPGTFNVVVTVQDDDGSATSDYLVNVIPPIAHLTGNVFRDFNNNGLLNGPDAGFTDVTVFADRDGDGELDVNEPFSTTDSNGDYQLDVGFEGVVSVRQVIPAGFKQTTPNPADVNVQFGDTVSVDSLGDNRIISPTIAVAGRLKALPFVQVRNADGTLRFSFTPFTKPATLKEVRLATGDVNDDGIEDFFVVPGPGASSLVKVFDGADGHLINSFTAFAATFSGGVSIAAGDVNGDGIADIVVGTEKGAGPLVKIFDGSNNQLIRSFVPTNASSYTGVKVALGDVDGDGVVDVITSPGTSTESVQYRIRAQDALTGASLLNFLVKPVNHGVATLNVAAGDLDHDGRAEILLTTSRNGQSLVRTFKDGVVTEAGLPFAANIQSTAFSVAAKDLTGDGVADLLFAGSQSQSPRLKLVNGATGQTLFSALLLGDKDRNGLIVG